MRSNLIRAVFLCVFCGMSVFVFPQAPASGDAGPRFSYKCIAAEKETFGYEIYRDGKLLIHQPTIPGASGTTGFRSKEDAEKVAVLVISKLKKNVMPPTVTKEELRVLKVID